VLVRLRASVPGVNDGREPERIEIELTSVADGGRRRRGRSDAPATAGYQVPPGTAWPPSAAGEHDATSEPQQTGPLATERGRLVVAALATGIVALFLGWAIGHSDGSGTASDAPDSSVDTGPSSVPTTTEVGVRVPTVSPSDLPTTTVRPVSTNVVEIGPPSTVLEGWRTEPLAVAPELATLGLDIVGLTNGGDVVSVDVAAGTASRARVNLTDDGYPRPVETGQGWILVLASDGVTARLIGDDGVPQLVNLSGYWELFRQPGTDLFQRVDQNDPGTMTLTPLNADGSPAGEPVDYTLPANWWPTGLDPAGGLVVTGPGSGAFAITPTGSTRIADGTLVAVSRTRAVSYDCEDDLDSCGLFVRDRATGETHAVPNTSGNVGYQSMYGYFGTSVGTTISPDDRYAVMLVLADEGNQGYRESLGLVSLDDGSAVDLTTFYNGGQVSWSPDGRYVLFLDGGILSAYDVETATHIRVSEDLESLTSFGVRPAQAG
jgi:hypothetical protein